jgi:hypothetical protein
MRWLLVSVLVCSGCSFDLDALRRDGGVDASSDASTDVGLDATPDVSLDSATDAPADVRMDAPRDAAPDGPSDAGDGGVDLCTPPTTPEPAPTPSFVRCRTATGGGTQASRSIAARGTQVFLTGFYVGGTDFGTGSLPSFGSHEVYWARLDTVGDGVLASGYGSTGQDRGEKLAIDTSGSTYVTGFFNDTIDFGTVDLTSAGMSDLFVTKYGIDGSVSWTRSYGDAGRDWGTSIAVTTDGDVVVAGRFTGDLSFGGDVLTAVNEDVFIAMLDSDGTPLRAFNYGGTSADAAEDVAADASGGFAVTGQLSGAASFGGPDLAYAGGNDGFVARYDSMGRHLWSRGFGGPMGDQGYGVAIDSCDRTVVTGIFHGTADFGGDPLTSDGDMDAFIASYDETGAHSWSVRFGGTGRDEAREIAIDDEGNIFVVGFFSDEVTFGPGDTVTADDVDAYVISFDRWGNYRWVRTFGGPAGINVDIANAITVMDDGNIAVFGSFGGNADIGCETAIAAGGSDLFVAVIDG